MLVFAVITVFVAGLMVGRTPEYLGKKIEAFEMKMASLIVIIPAVTVLAARPSLSLRPPGQQASGIPVLMGSRRCSTLFSSAANNNGSAFAELNANSVFYNITLGLAMLIGRYGVMIPVLAMGGSLAAKKVVPAGPGTLPTHTPLFVILLVGVVLLVGR